MTFSTFASPGVGLQGGGGSGGGGTASLPISGNGATITTSTPLINGTQTWNSGATTFTSLLLNVTDTASAAGSLLMDLQVGGSSRFNVGKTGSLKLGVSPTGTNQAGTNVIIAGSQGTGTGAGGSIIFQVAPAGSTGTAQNALATALTINSAKNLLIAGNLFNADGVSGIQPNTANIFYIDMPGGGLIARNNASSYAQVFNFATSGALTLGPTSAAAIIVPDAANTLALRNGTNPQTFNVYNTFTSSTNFERYSVDWITTSNLVIVGPNKGSGGGTQRVQRLAYLEDGGTGSTTPSLGTTCPAASATIKSWIKVITSDGSTGYIPCWA